MAKIIFPFRKEKSVIFGAIFRPIAKVFFWSAKWQKWEEIWMVVDTGADHTLLPGYLAPRLGVDLTSGCEKHKTGGVGGEEVVYLYKDQKVRLGGWNKVIPVGFLDRDNIPPLLGRQDFLEDLRVIFEKHKTAFEL